MRDNVPILGANQQVRRGVKYAVQLATTDGEISYFAANFQMPTGPGGAVDLKAQAEFNPMMQLLTAVEMAIVFAHRLPVPMPQDATGAVVPPMLTFQCLGGIKVVPAHVTGFRYLGEVVGDDGVSILVDRLIDRGPEVRRERYVYGPGRHHDAGPTPVSCPPAYGDPQEDGQ